THVYIHSTTINLLVILPVDHPTLHSFPTRRSSDLRRRRLLAEHRTRLDQRRVGRGEIAGHQADDADRRLDAGVVSAASAHGLVEDRKSTRLNSSHRTISYAVFCLKKKKHI